MTEIGWIGFTLGLKAGALMALGLLLVRALAPGLRLSFLRVLALAVLALPLLAVALPPWLLPLLPAIEAPPSAIPAIVTEPATRSAAGVDWVTWLLGGYFASVALLIGRFVLQLHRLRRWADAARPLGSTGPVLAGRDVRIGWSAHVSGPVSFGWPTARVLLPAHWRGEAGDRVGHALAHELAHVERRDWLWLVPARALHALCWWNPLVYPLLRALDEETELACDRRALTRVGSPAAYARSLVSLAGAPTPAALPMSGARYWRRRLSNALNTREEQKPMSKTPLTLAGLSMLALLGPLAACQLVRAAEPLPPAAPTVAGPAAPMPAPMPMPALVGEPAPAPRPAGAAEPEALPELPPPPAAKPAPVLAPRPLSDPPPTAVPRAPEPEAAARAERRRLDAAQRAALREEAAERRAAFEARRAEMEAQRSEIEARRAAIEAERARRKKEIEGLEVYLGLLETDLNRRRADLAHQQALLTARGRETDAETDEMRYGVEVMESELAAAQREMVQARAALERTR